MTQSIKLTGKALSTARAVELTSIKGNLEDELYFHDLTKAERKEVERELKAVEEELASYGL